MTPPGAPPGALRAAGRHAAMVISVVVAAVAMIAAAVHGSPGGPPTAQAEPLAPGAGWVTAWGASPVVGTDIPGNDCDGVVDFDRAVADPADPDRMLAAYDGGDHLHPGDAGCQAMADAVNLAMLVHGGRPG